ncbi:hypothetical protein KPL71_001060 [Citrus sinensis]|uniref:Uncharacterized protein n=1 Tax=Citrus sinensis TaxID=2711 RepID=A0ACB8NUC6_CITSI|nr:hypothetical protein KPL71_001060 [Citrus sinensis]
MDRSWITCDRLSVEYRSGVADFLDFAILNAENRMSIRCPCTFCCNMEFHTPQQVKDHLFEKGFLPRYIVWTWHGETDSKSTFTNCEDHSHSQRFRCHDYSNIIDMVEDAYEHCDRDPSSFKDMLEDAEKPLYPGAKHSKLSNLMRLYNVKGNYGWSDKGFSALLEVLADILPNNNTLPMSMYEVKKTMEVLGLEYEKIHACPNDCILYRNEFADLAECPNCGASRLKRLFQSPQTAQNLTWHANKRIRDGKLRHPADSPAWQLIDNKWPKFAQEPRNLRLALSTDEVNPHSTLSTTYSCWPVILITYNLPPWLCMKRKFLMLSLLISGPKQPGNDLDVYLAPLIEDLKTLWDVGIDVYDSYRKETFNLRAVLMWTISDFPAYRNLSGCTVKGYYACPICGIDTCACWLPHSRKMSYMGHRRFLPLDHLFQKLKKVFNGKQEWNEPPKTLSGEEIFNMVEDIDIKFRKKKAKKRKHDGGGGGGDPNTLDQLQEELVITLCLLQQYFPPSFFDIMIHLTVHLVEQVRLCGPVYLRWMYPFERQMKTLKDYVRNRYHPEGCIVESYIAEEALAFCAEYLSNCDVIGLPTGCPTDLSIEKPLGGANIKVVDDPLLAQAHRCVLMNTPEIQIYIEEHMHYLASRNPYKAKTNLWLQNEHIRTFSGWLQAKVAHDKANNVPIDEIVCWLANKPRSSVVTFSGYEINGFNFTTRDRDCNRVTQNSGVRVVANTLQISSSKDKSPHFGDMTFYGVIDDIWQLDYLMVKKTLFKCDWVDDRGVCTDNLGFTVVDLNRIGYKSYCFILACHAKQVFYVKDQLENNKSIVCSVTDKAYKLNGERCEDVDVFSPLSNKLPVSRRKTNEKKTNKKKGLQKQEVSHEAAIEYNSYGVPVGKGRNDLRSYIGVIVRETNSILLDDWRRVPLEMKETLWVHFQKKFKLSLKCKSQVLKWMGVASRNFRCELATEFVLPNKDDRKSLRLPSIKYPSIKKEDWKLFVDKVLSEQFQEKSKKAKDKRAKNVYNHRLGSTGYGGMLYRKVSVKKESGVSEREIDRSEAWLMARADRDGKYASDVTPIAEKINELKSHVEQGTFQSQGSHDILGEALQKQPNGSRVQRVGQFVTPSMYFHVPDATELARERKMYQESFQFMSAQLECMNARLNAYNNTEVGSSNFPKPKTSTGVQIDNDQQSPETLGKRKADFPSGKSTPKSVKSKIKDSPTTISQATPQQTPEKVDCEITSKPTPRISPQLTPKVLDIQFSCHDKVPNKEPPVIRPAEVAKKEPRVIIPAEVAKKEPRVIRPAEIAKKEPRVIRPAEIAKKEPRVIRPAAKDLNVPVKNTRAAARSRKNDRSEYMNMFTMFIENSLPRLIRIRHDTATFGEIWETHLDKMICAEIIEFKEVSNCIINIWIKHLYEEMESNGSTKPVQFGLFEKLYPRVSFKDRTQYISKLLGLAELGQVIVFPYNPGGIRIHQSLNSDTKANVQWIPVKPSSFECGYYVMKYMQDIITNVNVLKNNRESQYNSLPSDSEWDLAATMVEHLKSFYMLTEMFSGTKYPTANLFFPSTCKMKMSINGWRTSDNLAIRIMADKMVDKFKKYWNEIHPMLVVAVVLDPRYKMLLIDFYFPKIYGDTADEHIERAHKLCHDLVKEYEMKAMVLSDRQDVGLDDVPLESSSNPNKYWDVDEFETFRSRNKCVKVTKSELDRYLDDELLDIIPNFDILAFWKMHTGQYPILGELAKDILAIPVSIVAFESAFSTGGRFLSPHRSRLHPNTLESLMCAQNWIWASSRGEVPENEIFAGEELISDDDDDDGAQSSSCLT